MQRISRRDLKSEQQQLHLEQNDAATIKMMHDCTADKIADSKTVKIHSVVKTRKERHMTSSAAAVASQH